MSIRSHYFSAEFQYRQSQYSEATTVHAHLVDIRNCNAFSRYQLFFTGSGWTVATGVELVVDDINLDGFVDILVRDLSDAISGAQDQIVYAPGHKGGAVGTIRAVDDALTQFLSEVGSWTENPRFFEDRTSSYQEPIVRLQETCYPDEDSQYCSYLPIVIGYVTVTIYTNASSEARNFANLFPVVNGSINLDVTLGSTQAIRLGGILEAIFGTDVLNGQLEQVCTGNVVYDIEHPLPCRVVKHVWQIVFG